MVKREDMALLDQLLDSLEEASKEFENYYVIKDFDNFNKSKKFILNIQKKISEIIQ
jgi:hypothetical protein